MSPEQEPSKIIEDEAAADIKKVLDALTTPVQLVLFTGKDNAPSAVQLRLLQEMASLSTKVMLQVLDIEKDREEAQSYEVEMVPCTIVRDEKDHRIRFYGITSGMEFPTLMEDILMISFQKTELDPRLEEMVRVIKGPVHIRVMVTLTCPYCPRMVRLAHQFAYVNEQIKGDMVETSEFPELSQRYDVQGVPHTVINETLHLQGALEAGPFYLQVLKATDPEQYTELEASLREMDGRRKVRKAEEGHVYDVAIVGAGPAGMSAAIYAVRKGLETLVLAKKLGGQVTYTSNVDNYLGLPGRDGDDLTISFRNHMESYEVAESIGGDVISVARTPEGFEVRMEGGARFWSRTVVYCAGKEYRRLNLPGEGRFLGRGIRFCATCDAPLYRGKKVAVVGGGNTALTAVRDLMGLANEVHLIHRRGDFRADASLLDDVLKAKNVIVHAPMVVNEYLGEEKLIGLRLEPVEGGPSQDLLVDGVFLGIGLDPNSAPVRGLVPLNDLSEISTAKDQSTSVPGFYAAGDVSDVPEKQISVAVGQGAIAAISAYRYLMSTGKHKIAGIEKDAWQ